MVVVSDEFTTTVTVTHVGRMSAGSAAHGAEKQKSSVNYYTRPTDQV